MPWYAYVLYALFVIVCLLLIGVVLLQPGKGDIALFGGGSQTAFGPRGAQKPLERATFVLMGLFMALAFVFSVPGVLAPRSVASGIRDEPPPKKEEKPGDKKPEDKKEGSDAAPAANAGEQPKGNAGEQPKGEGPKNSEPKDAGKPEGDKKSEAPKSAGGASTPKTEKSAGTQK
ncbi:MAG: preprotein translocase subunit SecG [Chloracidobacterium sp.]|nr:preprotein translocase subunit SecG [Chloracidobacterium sp.]MDW8217274.1 preprotein translocase subunit SecG [Acidobacteriota bacterium]